MLVRALAAVSLLSLVSCGPPSYLITDPLFREAAPEVVTEWRSLWPLRNAQSVDLTSSEPAALMKALDDLGSDARVLVGVALTADQRRTLASDHRVFLSSPIPGVRTMGVDRAEAWALVARRVLAEVGEEPGWVLFPPDVTPVERQTFVDEWPPGRPPEQRVWPQPGPGVPALGPVFQWAGPTANPLVADLSSLRYVSGDPGMLPPGSRGYTWKIANRGLGELLWKGLVDSPSDVTKLPLETVPTSR